MTFAKRVHESASPDLRAIDALFLMKEEFAVEFGSLGLISKAIDVYDDGHEDLMEIRWNETASNVLYGEKHPKVDKVLTSLLAIKWIFQNDHYSFKREKQDISPQAFDFLREVCLNTLQTSAHVSGLVA